MLSTVIVGLIFAALLTWSVIKTRKNLKSGKCAGCSVEHCASRK